MTRRITPLILTIAMSGCVAESTPPPERTATSEAAAGSAYLFVWAGDADGTDSDFLAVIDASPLSERYGEVVASVPVGNTGRAHHTEHVMPSGNRLVANSFDIGQSWIFNLEDPERPSLESTFTSAAGYSSPHSFDRTPEGNILATFQYKNGNPAVPGGLVELDPLGNFVRGSDAADPADPELRPYSLAIAPEMDRVLTTTSDMSMEHEGSSVQIWSLSELRLLHTLPLPAGPRGEEHLNPAEPRFLPDGSALVNTFNCGLYHLTGIDGEEPSAELVASLPREGRQECSLPVLYGDYWVQTVDNTHSIVVLDISEPRSPVTVDELAFAGASSQPHWISLEPGGNRIVMTGYGELAGLVVLLEIDPDTGSLARIDDFGGPGAPGVSMNRETWPHGTTGPAVPHGAVFSR